jgi:hypothetical protein
VRSPTPPRCSLVRDVTPSWRGGFRPLAPSLRQIVRPEKFKVGHIDKYDRPNNPEEFIQVYHSVIETTGGDDRLKANYDHICAMLIKNFQGTYERPSTTETLKTIMQKHDETLRDYMKCFCNARNAIPYIQDIETINAFRDRVSDIKNVEEITMKKPKIVADLLAVADTCIEASEARARLLESRGKGPAKKKQDDREVNTTNRGDRKDHEDCRYRRNHQHQSSDQKEKRHFRQPYDVEKWCEIHRTSRHDLEEYKTFLDHKKM